MHLTLRHKINAAIIVTLILISLFFTAILIPIQQQSLEKEVGDIELLLKTLVERDIEQLANEIFDTRLKAIHIRLNEMRSVPGILSISVFDNLGKRLAADGSIVSRLNIHPGEIKKIRQQIHVEQKEWNGQGVLVFSNEINFLGEHLGFIRIHYSLGQIEKEQQHFFIILGGLLLVTLVVILVVLNFILSKAILFPIIHLRDAARSITMGNLEKNINMIRKDELGNLADSFDTMRDAIKEKISELKRITNIIESTTDLVCITSPDRKMIYLNKAGRTMIGMDETESLGEKEIADFYPEWASEKTRNGIRTAIQTGTWEGETVIIGSNGNEIPVSQVIICHFDSDERVEYLSTIIRDISEPKEAERALKESEKQLRLITDNMVDTISRIDAQANLIYASPSLERIYGYSAQHILGKSVIDWVHPDDMGRVSQQIKEARQKGISSILLEYRWRHENGEYLWTESAIRLLYDEHKNSKGAIFVSRDITNRKKMEEELTREKILIDAIFNSIPGLIYLYDAEGKLIRWNKKHELMTGYSSDELSKMALMEWFKGDAEGQKAVAEGLKETMENGFGEAEANLQKKDGSIIPSYFTASPLTINGQQYFTGIGIDITERKRAEEEQKRLQVQLVQSQKMQAIGTLAGGIAHDFNNILSGIFGYANLAAGNLDDTIKAKKHIEQIINGARRATDLVQQILTFSRKTDHQKRAVKLSLIVKEAMKFLRSSIPSNIEIKERIESHSVAVVDPTQFHQIIMNLCTNAFQAMKETGGMLSISLQDIEVSESTSTHGISIEAGNYIQLDVSDTGQGMDPDTLERVFEPYFTTKEIGEGTGLGLSVVLGIVEEHEGYLKSYSELGKGSRFEIYLPVSTKNAGINPHQLKKKKSAIRRGTETIMVVDDDESILSSTQEILENYGYRVKGFNDGEKAFAAFKKNPDQFHLIISDITMPKMTGRDLSMNISKIRDDIPIILCSGYRQEYSKDKTIKKGRMTYLQKPVDSQDLLLLIRELFDQNLNN